MTRARVSGDIYVRFARNLTEATLAGRIDMAERDDWLRYRYFELIERPSAILPPPESYPAAPIYELTRSDPLTAWLPVLGWLLFAGFIALGVWTWVH